MLRLGLCCIFRDEPIKFRTTTAAVCMRLTPAERAAKLGEICRYNADSLMQSLEYCASNGIGSFRVLSQLLPLKTHPQAGYQLEDLPGGTETIERLVACGEFARSHDIRTTFHPDQFVVLNSQRPQVVDSSICEIEYQNELAEWIGADVINIHVGGAFGDKAEALKAFAQNYKRLSAGARSRLTVENDDKMYTPADLVEFCRATGVPLVYDVHHHRCNRDAMTIETATACAVSTWNREPLFHISSPIEGWSGPHPERHHDFINLRDFPRCWEKVNATIEIEAKAKELAVRRLRKSLEERAFKEEGKVLIRYPLKEPPPSTRRTPRPE